MGAVCVCCRPFCPCCACCCPKNNKIYTGVTDSEDEIAEKSIKIQVQAPDPEPIPNEKVQLLSDYDGKNNDAAHEVASGFGPFTNKYSFRSKNNVILQHHFGRSLMNKNGQLSKKGAAEDISVWSVEFNGKEDGFLIIKLRNKSTNKYLRIMDNGEAIDCLGTGGKYTRFKVHQTDDNRCKFESVLFSEKYIAVNKEGVTVNSGDELSKFHIWSDSIDEAAKGNQPGTGAFVHPFMFNADQRTVIMKHYYGETLRINPKTQSDLDVNGGNGQFAQFCVEIQEANGSKTAQLKSIKSGKYIQMIADDKIDCLGNSAAKHVQFKVHQTDTNLFKFESIVFEGRHIAVSVHDVVVGIGDDLSEFTLWSNVADDKKDENQLKVASVVEKKMDSEESLSGDDDEEERVWYDNIEDISSFLKKTKKKKKDIKIEFTAEFWRALNKKKARKFHQILMELGEFVGVTNFDLRMSLWERVDARRKKLNTMTGLTKLLYQLVIEYINQKDKKRKKPEEKNVKTFMQYLAQNIIELENFPTALKRELEKEIFARSIDNWMTALIEKYKGQ